MVPAYGRAVSVAISCAHQEHVCAGNRERGATAVAAKRRCSQRRVIGYRDLLSGIGHQRSVQPPRGVGWVRQKSCPGGSVMQYRIYLLGAEDHIQAGQSFSDTAVRFTKPTSAG